MERITDRNRAYALLEGSWEDPEKTDSWHTVDERESLRLADLDGLSHEESGKCMGVSRATFGRILHKARQTVADALINGKAIKVDGGNYKMVEENRQFSCRKCHSQWDEPLRTGRPECCPACGQDDFHRFLSE
ncbi:MAG: DUF134 domain-containing protein [Desulfosarcina sp.]|nr:DUF134 domain-containing protein [Desulfosarcina sp.]MBC2765976.1 DUF134 domain-containing protein [Desulfosarcina sp.]